MGHPEPERGLGGVTIGCGFVEQLTAPARQRREPRIGVRLDPAAVARVGGPGRQQLPQRRVAPHARIQGGKSHAVVVRRLEEEGGVRRAGGAFDGALEVGAERF